MDTPNTTSGLESASGRSDGRQRSRLQEIGTLLRNQWLYIGIAIVLATVNLLLGIVSLSYMSPKKDALLFGIVCFGILIALGHFASLCYLIQRAKHESSDPSMIDAACALGIAVLFAISGAALTVQLPRSCYAKSNAGFKVLSRGTCYRITGMAGSSWLAVLIMLIATIIIFLAARRAVELAKLPPPVFPAGAEAPVMRWLDRNDPFLTYSERRQQYV